MGNPADTIEDRLLTEFTNGTGDAAVNKPPMNVDVAAIKADAKSLRQFFRANLEQAVIDGKFSKQAKAEVLRCALKAGTTARLIAAKKVPPTNNVDVDLFNLACSIVQALYAIDQGAGGINEAHGIVC